MFDNI
jgi:hypothetical protein